MKLNAHLDFDIVALEQEDLVHVLIDLSAPELKEERRRDPATLQIVLDRSGSMANGSLEAALRAIDALVGRLRSDDRLGLVIFDENVHVPVPADEVGDGTQIRGVLRQIGPGGMTDLGAGLIRGVQEIQRVANGSGGTLVLLSDGHANRGIVEHERLESVATGAYGAGIGTSTIGIGLGYDEELLASISRGGQGNAHFAEQGDAAGAQLASEVDGLLEQTVQAASLIVRPGSAVDQVRLFNELPVSEIDGGFMVELGGFYGGETRRLLLELDVPAIASLGVASACELELRWVEAETMESKRAKLPVNVNVVPGDEAAGRVANPTVETELAFQEAQREKDAAVKALQDGDVYGAQRAFGAASLRLDSVRATAPPAMASEAEAEIALLKDLAQRAESDARYAAKMTRADWHMKNRKRGRRR